MAKTISDENIRLNLIINGNAAQKELLDLEKKTREYTKANKELSEARKKLVAEGKKESQEYKNLSKEMKENSNAIKLNKARMEELQKEIGITGLTMAQLSNKAKLLKIQLLNAVPGGEAYAKYKLELKEVQNRMNELSGKAVQTKLSLSSLADGFNKYAALGASVIAAGTGIVFSLQKMIDYNGKLSDAQADVMKTTGQTKDEVDELTKSFGMLLTRTSRIDLLKIAEEGGRIGILKEDIGAFVEVMNKANVALGDSFTGGVEEVASKLGKLKLLFNETKEIGVEQAYNAIGSAINDLGANGVATELNIANFATRVGSLPDALKPSISQALALGAAFEESGIEAEIAGRGYNIFLKQASTESDKFAKVMGVTKQEVENMINTNPTEFFLKFSEGLKGMNATETANTLQYLGVNAEGANKIVGAAGNNIDRFRELLDLSNKSMLDANSLTNEYTIKNNNLAATLDKVKKKMYGWFSSEGLVAWLESAVGWFAKFIGATDDVDGKTTVWRNRLIALIKTVLVLTTSVLSYKAGLQLATLWTDSAYKATALYNLVQKATTLTTNFLTAATLLGQAAFFALTGQLALARTAMIAFNTVAKISPWGLILGVIGAVVASYVAFSESSEKAATKQSLLNDALKETSKNINTEKEELKLLLKIARDETQSKEQRQKAIDELNKRVPEYNNNLTIESAKTLDATNKLNKYIEAKEREILADILLNDWKKKLAAQKDAENSSLEENINWLERTWSAMKTGGQFFAMERANVETAIENKVKLIDVTKQEAELAKQLYEEQLKKNSAAGDDKNTPKGPSEGDTQEINGETYVFKGGKWQKLQTYKPVDDNTQESKEKRLTEFIAKQYAEREMAHKSALEKDLAQIDEKYRAELKMAEGNSELTKQLLDLKETEKQDLILQRTQEFENKKKELQNQIDLQNITEQDIADQLKLEQQLEKELAELEHLSYTEQQKADLKLKIIEKYNNDVNKLLDKAAAERLKKQKAADLIEINFEKEKATLKLELANQLGTALIGILGNSLGAQLAAIALNAVIEIAKLKIATSAAQQINLANAVASAPPPLNAPAIAAAGIQNAALGASSKLKQTGIIASAAIGGLGALLSNKKTKGYEKGLYPVTREQDGKQFNATFGGQTTSGMVGKPTVFMAGENGPEMIIDSNAYKQINPNIKYALHREIARVKGFESGYYNENAKNKEFTETSTANNEMMSIVLSVVQENTAIMKDLKESGVIAYMSRDLKNAKLIKEDIDEYVSFRNKNKM
ncbi:phage tail tape measure protein [Lutibacter sp.]|uniref:phage tail tape measure protein n=1 Tax=Lutibacter sp. TaxID=1925666 RepID=UPI00356661D4